MTAPWREGNLAWPPGIGGLILSGLFAGILACSPILPQLPTASGTSPFKNRAAAELVQTLGLRTHQFRSLRALATISYWGTEGRGGFQEAILVHRPDRLRLETLSPLGAILIVTIDADEITGFHPREGLFYRGVSSKENLFRYTKIPLELEELTSLLMGLPPVEAQGQWEEAENAIQRQQDGRGKEIVTFHPTLDVATKWERLGVDGEVELRALFADFVSTPAGLFPLKISLEAHAQQRRVEIHYQEPEVNAPLPFSLFAQEKPASAREIPLESFGG